METASIFEEIVNALVALNMPELEVLKREIIGISLSHPYGDNMRVNDHPFSIFSVEFKVLDFVSFVKQCS